jgi:hypothetical protein
MQDIFATGNRIRPAHIFFEIGFAESQSITRLDPALLQQGEYVALTTHAAHSGAHLVARLKKLQYAITADKS